MPLLVGAILAISVGLMATVVGLDRDRAFYPTVMIVIALLYVLFAVIGGSTDVLLVEALVASVFIAAAIWGFRSSLWIVVVALAAHGCLDVFHGRVIANRGAPEWWPQFCATYDILAAAYLAWLLRRDRSQARFRKSA
ncbi:MAG: hypothetical protein ACKVU1_13430 [bacterium]